MTSADLAPFKTFIKQRCGLVFDGSNEANLRTALQQRRTALGLGVTAYWHHLHDDAAEFARLVSLLTINESYFFREPAHIALLVDDLAPRFLAARPGAGPVRILSAGCASGEEPYSLAIALQERYGADAARCFSIIAGDIDHAALERARQARYSEFAFRALPAHLKARYFAQAGPVYALNPEIKQQVAFYPLNLLNPQASPELRDFDVIFFRNVSIYFDAPTRACILRNLADLMQDAGVLIVGSTETLGNDLEVLSLVQEHGQFYFVKGVPAPAPIPDPVPVPTPTPLWVPPPVVPPDMVRARQLVQHTAYDEALPLLDAVLAQQPGHTEALLLKAHVLLNRKDFAQAQALAHQVWQDDIWSVDALLLLGLAAKWQQQDDTAIRYFKRATYAQHRCWPAHYYLAELYRQQGASALAGRAYRVVVQLLLENDSATGLRHVPLGLPASEVRFLCEHQLARLG